MSHFECEPEAEPESGPEITAVAAPPAAPAYTPLAPRMQQVLSELRQSPPIVQPLLLRQPNSLRYDLQVPNGYHTLENAEMAALCERSGKMLHFTNLVGRCDVFSYVRRFGLLSEEHPFGNSLWHGVHEAALEWQRENPIRPMGDLLRDWEPAWFCPPEEWSKLACTKPFSSREARSKPHVYADGMYPTWVRKQIACGPSLDTGPLREIKCLHIVIVIMRHSWYVHRSRIICVHQPEIFCEC